VSTPSPASTHLEDLVRFRALGRCEDPCPEPRVPPGPSPEGDCQLALRAGDPRRQRLGPNHHLWRNGRLWWVAYTVIVDGWRQERIRHSLGTSDLVEARARRDAILATFGA
jgi:hypothetical protein